MSGGCAVLSPMAPASTLFPEKASIEQFDFERDALYRKQGESLSIAGQTALPLPKGEWARLGIRCDTDRVIGYVDGKPLLRDRSSVGSFELALFADAGVTAQFDDLKCWAKK